MNILIAEDDPVMQELLQGAFAAADSLLVINMVSDGLKALRYLATAPEPTLPDLIVLDYNMPILSGEEVLQKIHLDKRYFLIPKIILSTHASLYIIEKCMAAGATRYIIKPASFSALVTIAKEITGIALPV